MDLYGTEELLQKNQSRAKKTIIFLSVFILILLIRLWYLQIMQGNQLRNFSDRNTIKEQKVTAPRGNFLDRNGQTLVTSRPGFRLALDPSAFRSNSRDELEIMMDLISNVLNKNKERLLKLTLKNYRAMGTYNPGIVAKEITQEEALMLKQLRLVYPKILVQEVIFRDYPLKESGAQIFGYVSLASQNQIKRMKKKGKSFKLGDQIGQTGLEESLDSLVRGKDGISYVQVDARGRVQNAANSMISYIGLQNVEPQIGNNVVLTIDRDLQKAAFEAFQRDDKLGERKGGLVALSIKGEVLAWASNPSFDPSLFQTGISSDAWNELNNNRFKPLTDKVAQGTYSPGSVFKPLVGLAALHFDEITKYTRVDSPGQIYFGGRAWHDHKRAGHGKITLSEAIEVSGNVFFYKLGMGLGVDKMSSIISRVGMGKDTGIEYISESQGLLPTKKWKKENRSTPWQRGEDLNYSIGQGAILTTMLQLARAYLTIASKGKVMQPILVKEILDENEKTIKSFKAKLIEDLTEAPDLQMDKKDFEAIIEGLIKVAHGSKGTARYRSSKKFLMAGKTGTAQVRSFSSQDIYNKCEDQPEKDRHHGFFVGFAPAEKPEIVVAGLALHGCHGSSGAAPMVTDLLTAYMQKHHPELFDTPVASIKSKEAE